jgi:uncharacterized LabA/DUF88 family protein
MENSLIQPAAAIPSARVRIFVDFWNLQLTINEKESQTKGSPDERFFIDWEELPKVLVKKAGEVIASQTSYEGTAVYTSCNSKTDEGKKYKKWATSWLDRQRGIQVDCRERHVKHPPKCPKCNGIINDCPSCHESMYGTVEKGVDTAIATDMIRLAWERAYDVAVLVTSDADLVPAVQFLDLRGYKVIQAGFPPHGSHLANACWASFDLFLERESFRRI